MRQRCELKHLIVMRKLTFKLTINFPAESVMLLNQECFWKARGARVGL